VTAIDVECSFDTLYVRVNRKELRSIDTRWKNRLTYENAESDTHTKFSRIYFQRIKMHCKLCLTFLVSLFSSFVLMKTCLFVAHGSVVSAFDLLNGTWVKHIFFEENVFSLFRIVEDGDPEHEQAVGVLQANGLIRTIELQRRRVSQGWDLSYNVTQRVDGTIHHFANDMQFRNLFYILHGYEPAIILSVFSESHLH